MRKEVCESVWLTALPSCKFRGCKGPGVGGKRASVGRVSTEVIGVEGGRNRKRESLSMGLRRGGKHRQKPVAKGKHSYLCRLPREAQHQTRRRKKL